MEPKLRINNETSMTYFAVTVANKRSQLYPEVLCILPDRKYLFS